MHIGIDRSEAAERCIKSNAALAGLAGLVPLPVADVAGVGAVQVRMVQELARIYEVEIDLGKVKEIVLTLLGAKLTQTLFQWAASAIKSLPGPGTVVGEVSQALISVATTYAMGITLRYYFELQGQVSDDALKEHYVASLEEGKRFAQNQQLTMTPEFQQELDELRKGLSLHLAYDQHFLRHYSKFMQSIADEIRKIRNLSTDFDDILNDSRTREEREK